MSGIYILSVFSTSKLMAEEVEKKNELKVLREGVTQEDEDVRRRHFVCTLLYTLYLQHLLTWLISKLFNQIIQLI